jgi:hypothetical protein
MLMGRAIPCVGPMLAVGPLAVAVTGAIAGGAPGGVKHRSSNQVSTSSARR